MVIFNTYQHEWTVSSKSYIARVFMHLRAKQAIDDRQKNLMAHHDEIVECKATFDADGKLPAEALAH